jgi:hypothetical protein
LKIDGWTRHDGQISFGTNSFDIFGRCRRQIFGWCTAASSHDVIVVKNEVSNVLSFLSGVTY